LPNTFDWIKNDLVVSEILVLNTFFREHIGLPERDTALLSKKRAGNPRLFSCSTLRIRRSRDRDTVERP
jgi:hypothetical protein